MRPRHRDRGVDRSLAKLAAGHQPPLIGSVGDRACDRAEQPRKGAREQDQRHRFRARGCGEQDQRDPADAIPGERDAPAQPQPAEVRRATEQPGRAGTPAAGKSMADHAATLAVGLA